MKEHIVKDFKEGLRVAVDGMNKKRSLINKLFYKQEIYLEENNKEPNEVYIRAGYHKKRINQETGIFQIGVTELAKIKINQEGLEGYACSYDKKLLNPLKDFLHNFSHQYQVSLGCLANI
jgi:hypothetical protein